MPRFSLRPHPFNADAWVNADFSDLGPVAIWPRQRYTPAEESARTSFFDSLFYSAAIVGINTSAMIEGAILSRPVLSLLTPEFAGTQEGTLHFHYLLPENGGFLRVAHSLDEHEAQLAEVFAESGARAAADRAIRRRIPAAPRSRRRVHPVARRRDRACRTRDGSRAAAGVAGHEDVPRVRVSHRDARAVVQ
jgi:hypothetical protein